MSARVVAWGVAANFASCRPLVEAAGLDFEVAPPPWERDVLGLLVDPDCAVGEQQLAGLPDLRVIASAGSGLDHIDQAAAAARGIEVRSTVGYAAEEVADSTVALALALIRGVVWGERLVARGGWDNQPAFPMRTVAGLRLGLMGFGAIGRAVAARARALGCEVAAHDPAVDPQEIQAAGVEPLGCEALLRSAELLSLHLPLTTHTTSIIDAQALALMPCGSYLINTARGRLVELPALIAALDTGRLAGAALDVLPHEPPSDLHPSPKHPRLLVTPHNAWFSVAARDRAYLGAAEQLVTALVSPRDRRSASDPTLAVPPQ